MADKTLGPQTLGPLTFGFDIGIASVGWAVLSDKRIIDLGVRCFDAAEESKEKVTLNAKRRAARVSRNRYSQRSSRLHRLLHLFVDVDLLSRDECKALFSSSTPQTRQRVADVWQLRADALDRPLSPAEFARVIHHLVKWRGYGSLRDAADRLEESGNDKEPGATIHDKTGDGNNPPTSHQQKKPSFSDALDASESRTERLLTKYRTIGQAIYLISRPSFVPSSFPEKEDAALFRAALRNDANSYERTQLRKHLRAELSVIFRRQRELGSPYVNLVVPDNVPAMSSVALGSGKRSNLSRSLEDQVLGLFDEQYPPIVAEQLEQLIGECQLIPAERRAPRECFSSERSRWLQTLNGIKVRFDGGARTESALPPDELTALELAALVALPYQKEKLTYKDLRDALCEKADWPRDYRLASFSRLSYRSVATPDSDQILVLDPDGSPKKLLDIVTSNLPKGKAVKAAKDSFRNWIHEALARQSRSGNDGTKLPLATLREHLAIIGECRFLIKRRRITAILPSGEANEQLPLTGTGGAEFPKGWMLKTRDERTGKLSRLPAAAMQRIAEWSAQGQPRTIADLRATVPAESWPQGNWVFIVEEKQELHPEIADESSTFLELAYTDAQEIEGEVVVQLKGWHKLRRALAESQPDLWNEIQVAWQQPLTDAGQAAACRIDQIFDALTTCFTDQEIEDALRNKVSPALPDGSVKNIRDIVSSGFGHLSRKALKEIQPFLEQGNVFDKACGLAGYDHSAARRKVAPQKYLPSLETFLWKRISTKTGNVVWQEKRYKELSNPVVARSFNQARRVLNALIARYKRSPDYVSIELARDLAKPGEERNRIDRDNKRRAKEKEEGRDTFIQKYNIPDPSPTLMRKVRMREEQQCKCMYSGKEIRFDDLLLDEKYCEVDHVLPRSRTGDNSLDNQVLVLAGENQRKGKQTPFEWRGQSDSVWWHDFQARVRSLPLMSEKKKAKLLLEKLDEATENEFIARNLVDTRYMTRLFARMVRDGLLFANDDRATKEEISPDAPAEEKLERFRHNRVRTPQGGVIAKLRGLWGLSKVRADGDLHHALDACVIAAATPSLIQRVNEYHRFEEIVVVQSDGMAFWRETGERLPEKELTQFVDKTFPNPFAPHAFREEVLARLSPDGKTYWTKSGRKKVYDFSNYAPDTEATIGPVLVSRLVQRHIKSNELHSANPQALRRVSIPLTHLTQEILDPSRYPEQFIKPRHFLFESLGARLAMHEGNAEIAFSEGHPEPDSQKVIHAVSIPWLLLTPSERKKLEHLLPTQLGNGASKKFKAGLRKVKLTDLTLEQLKKDNLIDALGAQVYLRNASLYQALYDALSKPGAKAEEVFKNGFPRPETRNQTRLEIRMADNPGYRPPIVRSIGLPETANSGYYVRGGLVGRGVPVVVHLYRHRITGKYAFRSIYAMADAYEIMDKDDDIEAENCERIALHKNDLLRIDHPSLVFCFRELHRWSEPDNGGKMLTCIEVEPIFPDKMFQGNYCYYEESNDRPVLQLHDRSPFFLLQDGAVPLQPTVLVEREKIAKRKNSRDKAEPVLEYVLRADLNLEPKQQRTFDLCNNIKRKINDARLIQQLHVDVLGQVANGSVATGRLHGLA